MRVGVYGVLSNVPRERVVASRYETSPRWNRIGSFRARVRTDPSSKRSRHGEQYFSDSSSALLSTVWKIDVRETLIKTMTTILDIV